MRKVLIQEEYVHDPWKMLVCCILLNRTHIRQVRPIVEGLFAAYPTPRAMSFADPDVVSEMIRSLGFKNRRTKTLIKFSQDYVQGSPSGVESMYGVGKYAMDSYRIFVEGRVDVRPEDKELRWYMEEVLGVKDSAVEHTVDGLFG